MWGIWDKVNHEFRGHYEVDWDVDEDIYPLGREGSHTYIFETELEAIAELESWKELSSYPEQYNKYEVMELPTDEPEWVYY